MQPAHARGTACEPPRRGRLAGFVRRHSNPLILIALLAIWQMLVGFGLVHNPAVPSPTAIAHSLWKGFLGPHHILAIATAATLGRLILGFAIALLAASALGLLAGRNDDIAAALNPLVALWIPLPGIVTIPVLSLWLGVGQAVIVCTVIFSAWIPLYLGALQGARSVAARQLWVARSYGATRWSTVCHIIVPSALVQMLPALRVGMGYAWRAVIAAEIITQHGEGLGVTIFAARQFFDVATMYAGVILIALLGLTIEKMLFPQLERRTLKRWGLVV